MGKDILDLINDNTSQVTESGIKTSYHYLGTTVEEKVYSTYSLIKDLGKGTFGEVKLGIHNYTKEKVAVKILEKNQIKDESDKERIAREINILKLIKHPNITSLYEIYEDDFRLYIIVEMAEKGELFDYIVQKQRIPEPEACKFYQQLVDSIEYIHQLKIVHRDLKPENLLLDKNMNIKVIDFGLSNLYEEGKLLKTACGSPCYAAPEMIAGKKYEGLKVDIWSSGVILFAMICGYLPFDDNETQKLYHKIMRGDYKIPSFVSKEGRDLIKRILNINPFTRITIDEIRKHPWFKLNQNYSSIQRGLIVGYHDLPVDLNAVQAVVQLGYEKRVIIDSLKQNRHNKLTTLYYLLLKKMIRKGHVSNADLEDINFRPQPKEVQINKQIFRSTTYQHEDKTIQDNQEERPKSKKGKVKYQNIIDQQHKNINKRLEARKKTDEDKLNYSSVKPYEKHMRDKSPISPLDKQDKGSKSKNLSNLQKYLIQKKSKRTKSVIAPDKIQNSSNTGIPIINKSGITNKNSYVSKKTQRKSSKIYQSEIQGKSSKNASKDKKSTSQRRVTNFLKNKSKSPEKKSRSKSKMAKVAKVSRGPAHIDSITMRDPNKLLEDLTAFVPLLSIEIEKVSGFVIKCKYQKIRFWIEINQLENFENFHIVKFYKNSCEQQQYYDFCAALFEEIRFLL